jgi:hypothetical protein
VDLLVERRTRCGFVDNDFAFALSLQQKEEAAGAEAGAAIAEVGMKCQYGLECNRQNPQVSSSQSCQGEGNTRISR